jgi:hypothetical protein
MDPETKRLDTEEQYRKAKRTLINLGFWERSETCAPGGMSCVLLAPDGYSVRLVFDEKAKDPS